MAAPDWKKEPRVRDKRLFRELHGRWRECALCGATDSLSLHHILKHPREDVEANLVMLCGDGVRGCHGAIEAHHRPTVRWLMSYLLAKRPDTIAYVVETLGEEAAADWFHRKMRA